jgi:sugar phosphate isomerase/epimerase
MRFGASMWPWKWDAPYEQAIHRLAAAGFRATELIAWDPAVITDYYTPATIASLRSALDGEGMSLSQFVVHNADAASGDPAKRRAAVDMFKAGVDVGVQLGAPIINTVVHVPFNNPDLPWLTDRAHEQIFTMSVSPDWDWDQNWLDYTATLRECAEYAESAGVVYSLEPHPFRYAGNVEGLLRLLETVDSPALGVNFDPSHLFPVGEIPHVGIYRLGKRVVHCHFSDNDGESNVHWRPGKGKIDWTRTMQALKDVGYDGVISLEFEDIPGVSRGHVESVPNLPANWTPREVATDEFEGEYRIALEYLTAIAAEVGLDVE